jgi:5-methylcytosine-specific restriction enzyme A
LNIAASAPSIQHEAADIVTVTDDVTFPDEVAPGATYSEGSVSQVLVNRYERDPVARAACLAEYGHACVVCEIDFGEDYGELGEGFIHVHHITPLSKLGSDYQLVPERDLAPVCPNCHSMLHRTDPPLSIQQLASIYDSQRNV